MARNTFCRSNSRRSGRSGIAAIEFALSLPVLALILLGTLEFGWYYTKLVMVNTAAYDAARVGAQADSGSQAVAFPKIAYQDLQPGDLVLFYSDLHHVGIYIGGGMMIHAPQTGDVVKIASAWRSNFMWGVRPS